jgi:hypothetical protein
MSRTHLPNAAPQHRAMPSGGGHTVLGLAGPRAIPVRRPRPHLAAQGLSIEGPVPLPGEYRRGTAGFRYWAMAEALERVAALWRAAADFPWAWEEAGRLTVHLIGGAAPQAVYERGRLLVGGTASPSAAMRALGHGVLDALRPELWHVAAEEVGALHAGFADAAAMLATMAMPGEEDASRHATTRFGATMAEVLAVLARTAPPGRRPPDTALLALRGARLMVEAVRRVAVTPDIMAQLAAELALAANQMEGPLVALQLRDLFARHGLLPRSPALEGHDPHAADDGTELPVPAHPLPWVATDAASLGLDRPLLLRPAVQPPLVASGADTPAPIAAARDFACSLSISGLVERPRIGRLQRRAPGTPALPTHRLEDDGRVLRLVRERFVVA